MKYLVLVLIVVAVIMLTRWSRPRRDAERAPDPARPAPAPAPAAIPAEAMLACAHCGVHLPRGEALPGRSGVYCSAAHQALHDAKAPQDHE